VQALPSYVLHKLEIGMHTPNELNVQYGAQLLQTVPSHLLQPASVGSNLGAKTQDPF
jgi:hypothetical protein